MVFKQYSSVLPSSRVGESDAIFTSAKLVCMSESIVISQIFYYAILLLCLSIYIMYK